MWRKSDPPPWRPSFLGGQSQQGSERIDPSRRNRLNRLPCGPLAAQLKNCSAQSRAQQRRTVERAFAERIRGENAEIVLKRLPMSVLRAMRTRTTRVPGRKLDLNT